MTLHKVPKVVLDWTQRPLTQGDMDAVLAIECATHAHPWTRGHFLDALNPQFAAQGLWVDAQLQGYFWAMHGFEELHLLNISVAPHRQGQGLGWALLDALKLLGHQTGAQCVWLEVRQSNARALSLYERYGYEHISLRKDYYPSGPTGREHAVVMRLHL
jgi:[ribosomal protein S18]-alanine N-acetyltransferase